MTENQLTPAVLGEIEQWARRQGLTATQKQVNTLAAEIRALWAEREQLEADNVALREALEQAKKIIVENQDAWDMAGVVWNGTLNYAGRQRIEQTLDQPHPGAERHQRLLDRLKIAEKVVEAAVEADKLWSDSYDLDAIWSDMVQGLDKIHEALQAPPEQEQGNE